MSAHLAIIHINNLHIAVMPICSQYLIWICITWSLFSWSWTEYFSKIFRKNEIAPSPSKKRPPSRKRYLAIVMFFSPGILLIISIPNHEFIKKISMHSCYKLAYVGHALIAWVIDWCDLLVFMIMIMTLNSSFRAHQWPVWPRSSNQYGRIMFKNTSTFLAFLIHLAICICINDEDYYTIL